jgi:hypothetical protein
MSNSEPRHRTNLAVAIAAIAIALVALLWPRRPAMSVETDLKVLRDEVAALRDSMTRADSSPPSTPNTAPTPEAESPDGVTLRQVHEWVWGLEQRLVELEQSVAAARSSPATTAPPAPDIVQSRQIALNPQAGASERLQALRALRTANARTPDVVQAMLHMQATSTDPNVRADVFRQLSGVSDPIMKPHLINGVLKDDNPKVREEAAETLAPFWADPYVQSALRSAAENDPDEDVRTQAAETLRKRRR